jgi:molecular chaperone DnaJ
VVVSEKPHNQLKREGANLFYTRVISITEAILGTTIDVPAIGTSQRLRIEPGTQSGTVVRMRGQGLPSINNYGKGDLFVKILVWIPRKLRGSDKEAVEQLAKSDAVRPNPSREDRALFEKESQYFN